MPLHSIGINIPIIAAIFGSIFGALVAFVLFYNHDVSKEKREVKKIQLLLNSDFARIYDLAKKDLKNIQKFKSNLDEAVENLYARKFTVDHYFVDKHLSFEFNFWGAITTSGSLIKLKADEIKDIQIMVDLIQEIADDSKKLEEQFSKDTRQTIDLISKNGEKKPIIRRNLKDVFAGQETFCKGIIEMLDMAQISWLKLKK